MKQLLLAGLLAMGLSACGGTDNVAACNSWLKTLNCGTYDFSKLENCTVWQDYTCDLSPYFDCLKSQTTCDSATGTPNTSNWYTCESKATCPNP